MAIIASTLHELGGTGHQLMERSKADGAPRSGQRAGSAHHTAPPAKTHSAVGSPLAARWQPGARGSATTHGQHSSLCCGVGCPAPGPHDGASRDRLWVKSPIKRENRNRPEQSRLAHLFMYDGMHGPYHLCKDEKDWKRNSMQTGPQPVSIAVRCAVWRLLDGEQGPIQAVQYVQCARCSPTVCSYQKKGGWGLEERWRGRFAYLVR
ncbi:hypothetical protein B0H67DRAFT_589376 [Lasiosphaeris hirsuta]|uniref:Uncharacterized protein n=1 Tax=Lasiosphaeris hirsuta TaxID=260670 RepID=A0AA40DP88_9PEZI|nr:hypothetical protein B0H67DRAFT_589376 [Lasiosphaeris hirsuta]